MPKVSLASLGAQLGAETLDYTDSDYESRIKNLPALASEPALAQEMLVLTRVVFFSASKWKAVGERLRALYTEGELNSVATKTALRSFLFLALSQRDKDDYYYNPPRKVKGEEESSDVKEMKKRKIKVQNRLSRIVGTVLEAAYPPQRVPKPDAVKQKEQEAARKALAGERFLAANKEADDDGDDKEEDSRPESRPESRYSDASAMDDGEAEEKKEEDSDADDARGLGKAAAGAGSVASGAKKQAKKDAADFERDRQPVFAVNEVYAEKVSLIRAGAEQGAKVFVAHSLIPTSWNAERTLIALPAAMADDTYSLFTTITATFNPDGSLTEAAKTAKQGTLPVGV